MLLESFPAARKLVLEYLKQSYQKEGEKGGWGHNGRPISVTNTAEAILTYEQLDDLRDEHLLQERDNIIAFLEGELSLAIDSKHAVTRYIAYATLALDVLGETSLQDRAVSEILSMAKEKGGWPIDKAADVSLLVPTYHALLLLQRLRVDIEGKHYEWLKSLVKPDGLAAFSRDDSESFFGASCLVLHLVANSEYSDRA